MTEAVLAILSGAGVGFLLALFGGGGSILATPLLLYVVGVNDPHTAIGTGAAAVAINAAISAVTHARHGTVKWPCAISFAIAGAFGALAGSTLGKLTHGDWLLLAFSGAMAVVALNMLRRARAAGAPDVHITPVIAVRLIAYGLLVGFAAGFFGIGGGFLVVPGLMAGSGMATLNAVGSSLISVSAFGVTTAANYAASGWVNWPIVGYFVLGGAVAGQAGAGFARRLGQNEVRLKRGFAYFILAAAAYVALQAGLAIAG